MYYSFFSPIFSFVVCCCVQQLFIFLGCFLVLYAMVVSVCGLSCLTSEEVLQYCLTVRRFIYTWQWPHVETYCDKSIPVTGRGGP
jgi:hypothetical protein